MLPPNTIFTHCFENLNTTVVYKVIGYNMFNGQPKEVFEVVEERQWKAMINEKSVDNEIEVCDN